MAKKKNAPGGQQQVVIPLEHELPEIPGRKSWDIPTQHLQKTAAGNYRIIDQRRPSKTLLPNSIRSEVDKWRKNNYTIPSGISDTSRTLLEFWFGNDHIVNNETFHFRFAQREAIETIIYLYEVKKVRDAALLAESYMSEAAYGNDLFESKTDIIETAKEKRQLVRVVPETGLTAYQDLPPEGLTRYCCKAATGSGKTFVMAFVTVWSYFHLKFENDSELSDTILIIAPNVIVYERLKTDFENGNIFRQYPFIPAEWKHDWQLTCIMREDQVKSSTDGTLYLTNIHQLYEKRNTEEEALNPVDQLLGTKPKKDSTASWLPSIYDRVKEHKRLLVINDEAHHVHDEELAWYRAIMNFHEHLKKKNKLGLSLLLDLSATPKDQNGTYFPWIITDYPLAQAIEDRIVKSPLIVRQVDKASPDPKQIKNAYEAYFEWIEVALSRWKEHKEYYGKLKQKPVLFIMAENTTDADQLYAGLIKRKEFSKPDEVLLIHTNNKGEFTDKTLDEAREAARKIDEPNSKVKIVISVLMLREGWDVKNVSIILGLRPFTSKANILPEQAVGRGLRLMQNMGPEYTQVLEIIGTDKFEEFVRALESEGVGVGFTRKTPPLGISIYPLKTRTDYNFEIPVLSASFIRKIEGIKTFDVNTLQPITKLDPNANYKEIKVELKETLAEKKVGTKQVVISDDHFPPGLEIIAAIARRVEKEGKFNGKFREIYPIVKQYVLNICFGGKINPEDIAVRRVLSRDKEQEKIVAHIAYALGQHIRVKTEVKVTNYPISLMELDAFPWKRMYIEQKKTIFNATPIYNELEKAFAIFLEKAKDINKFAALAETYTKFSIPYLNKKGCQSLYYPDFIAEQQVSKAKTINWIIETKGYEDENVALKDAEAEHWCTEASKHTGQEWRFLKVPDKFFRAKGTSFELFAEMLTALQKWSKGGGGQQKMGD